jgi:hypothetical protein
VPPPKENSGQSEVWYFETGDNCPVPTGVTATAGWKKMTVEWQPLPEHEAFVVEYRLKSLSSFYEWTSEQTFADGFTAIDLTPGWTYEYRVGAIGKSNRPVFSPTGEVTLPEKNEQRLAQCGIEPTVDLTNSEPKEGLKPGDVVTVGGDASMTVTEVASQGGGWYSGKGYTTFPWILEVNVAVKFDRLRVNTDNRQIDGEVESEYDPKASQIARLNELGGGGSRTNEASVVLELVELDFALPDDPMMEFDTATGQLTVWDDGGVAHVVPLPEPKNDGSSAFPIVVVDKDGNKYQVDLPEEAKNRAEATTPADSTATAPTAGERVKPIITPISDVDGEFDRDGISEGAEFVVRFTGGGGRYAFDPATEPWYRRSTMLQQRHQRSQGFFLYYKKTTNEICKHTSFVVIVFLIRKKHAWFKNLLDKNRLRFRRRTVRVAQVSS